MTFEAPKEDKVSVFGKLMEHDSAKEVLELIAPWFPRVFIFVLITSFLLGGTIGYWVSYILWR